MNLKDIKSQFPIFKSNKNLIYFDTANSAQKPKQVIDAYWRIFIKIIMQILVEPFMALQQEQQRILKAHVRQLKNLLMGQKVRLFLLKIQLNH